jgi:CRISPR system Cascade subunit CasC
MTNFIQLHSLTVYPPSNLNRDDLGRPKSAVFGNTQRLRISSQSLKRAWRTSSIFSESLHGNLGIRTKEIGHYIERQGASIGVDSTALKGLAKKLVAIFGGDKKEDKKGKDELKSEQLVFMGTHELAEIDLLLKKLADGEDISDDSIQNVLKKSPGGVDVAMFGRMLASAQDYNIEAAVQVAHALSVHKVTLEDDYFTAVDDLGKSFDRDGAAHIDVNQFGAGVFYEYICIDIDRLKKNLSNDMALVRAGISGLVSAALTTSPSGKQNSYAHGSYASYAFAEIGTKQPRSLCSSFLNPVKADSTGDVLTNAIKQLRLTRDDFDAAFGKCATSSFELAVPERKGSLVELIKFVTSFE